MICSEMDETVTHTHIHTFDFAFEVQKISHITHTYLLMNEFLNKIR